MDKKSRIFFLILFLLIVSSVVVTYYRIVVRRDYMIQAEATCDPYTESCFVSECDPATATCTGDPKQDTSYYKLIDRNAKNIPLCNLADETCTALVCGEGEANCTYTLCDPATAKDGEVCNDPVIYTQENPVEEENSTDVEGGTTGDEAGAETGADTTTDVTGTPDATDTTGNVQSDVTTPQAGTATGITPVQVTPTEKTIPQN